MALTIAVSPPDDHGHVWSAERCERCWCEPGWPLARQPCPFRKAKAGENGVWEVEDDDGPVRRRESSEEARARAREKQRERRSKMDPETVRAQNRLYKQRQRAREREGRSGRRQQQSEQQGRAA